MNREAKPEKPAEVRAMNAPSGIDLRPQPTRAVQVSKRAGIAVCCLAAGVLGLFAYGGYKRQRSEQTAARGEAKQVAPATAAGTEILKEIQSANVSAGRAGAPKLEPPPDSTDSTKMKAPAAHAARFAAVPGPVQPATSFQRGEPTAEEKQLLWAYQQEQAAMTAPTAIHGGGSAVRGSSIDSPLGARSSDDAWRMAVLAQALGNGATPNGLSGLHTPASGDVGVTGDSVAQNGQSAKEAFLDKARSGAKDNYLRSMRTAPLSKYEIKAGWEIPAVMEQGLNSDLPGELKALVAENVFDTATGKYLLIPQGARLVGVYDSHVSYGQNGVQAVWNRIIFPDASTIDLNGMTGQDAQGYSGFRQTVDHHYKRLIGFAALTSLFSAGFAVSQNRNQSALTYPSASQVAASAVGAQVTQLGAEMTRRNLNVQPTVKISARYKFHVRVNRDIIFDGPYRPIEPAQ